MIQIILKFRIHSIEKIVIIYYNKNINKEYIKRVFYKST